MSSKNMSSISIAKKAIISFFKKTFPALFYKPHMLADEFALFKKTVANDINIVEFGAGGSTIYFLKTKKKIFSVENNDGFTGYLKSMKFFNDGIKAGRLKFLFINTGPTTGWGKPQDESLKENWIEYATKVWETIPKDTKIDTVFIDGRFRVLTAIYGYLNTSPDTKFMIHDFNKRSEYKAVLEFLDPVETASQLVVFKKKEISEERLKELTNIYRYDYS